MILKERQIGFEKLGNQFISIRFHMNLVKRLDELYGFYSGMLNEIFCAISDVESLERFE